jgi:hypothetical protein
MMKLPTGFADRQAKLVSRRSIGDLTPYGLPQPEQGPMTRLKREGKAPAIVDKEMIDAIKGRRIEVVPAVESLDESGVVLSDGARLEPAAVIAATGYTTGLDQLVGHLGVLDERGVPRVPAGREAAPGLRFIGYVPRPGQIRAMGREARRAAKQVAAALAR